MDGTGSDNNEEAVEGITSMEDGSRFLAAGNDGVLRLGGLGDFMLEEVWRREGIV